MTKNEKELQVKIDQLERIVEIQEAIIDKLNEKIAYLGGNTLKIAK